MTNKDELEMWSKLLLELQSIPDYCRSRNHTEYLREVQGRVYDCEEAEQHIKSLKKP